MPTMTDQEPRRCVFPIDPHVLTYADLEDFPVATFPPRPGLAPVLSFPLQDTHPIVLRWPVLCSDIVEKLNVEAVDWVAVECLRRRQHPSKGDARSDDSTILITVKTLPEVDEGIRNFLNEVYSLTGLYVELSEGGIWSSTSDANNMHATPSSYLPYALPPPMGGSLEPSTHPGRSGTLGGYLELFKGKENKTCAITCDHVIGPDPAGAMNVSGTRVLYPSSCRLSDIVTAIEEERDETTARKDDLDRKLANTGPLDPPAQKSLDTFTQFITTCENEIHAAHAADREIGVVFARSGLEVVTYYRPSPIRIDWALVEAYPKYLGTNEYYRERGPKVIVDTVGLPSKSCRVSKTGQMTGFTKGVVNPTESCLHWDIGNKVSMEWVIVSDPPLSSTGAQKPFSIRGDSGSLVTMRSRSTLLGMLWGGTVSNDRTYFTPIDVIAKDILRRTGFHVRLPHNGQHICC